MRNWDILYDCSFIDYFYWIRKILFKNQENKERFLLIKDIYLKNCNNLGIDHLLQFFCYDSQALMNYFYNMKMN